MNVRRDPPTMALPVSELDEYVGTYQITPALVVKKLPRQHESNHEY